MPLFEGRGLSSSSHPRNTSDAMRGKRSGLNVAARPRGGSGRNKMEKREVRPRKFNRGGRGRDMCGVTRPPRGANPTVQTRTSAAPRSEGYRATTFGRGMVSVFSTSRTKRGSSSFGETRSADCHWRRLNKLRGDSV